MATKEEIREEFNKLAHYFMGKYFGRDISVKQFNDKIDATLTALNDKEVVIKTKCPDCVWSEFVNEESVGMTPCYSCNSTGYLVEPLIEEVKV